MNSRETRTPAASNDVDVAKQHQTLRSMSDVVVSSAVVGRRPLTLSSSAEIEIPLELVRCDERMPRRADDMRSRLRMRLDISPVTEGALSPLHEEEFTTASSSSSSSQSTSPDDDGDDWEACCSDDKLSDRTLTNCWLTTSQPVLPNNPVSSAELSNVEVMMSGSTVPAEECSTMTCSRMTHHSSSGLSARLGSLLNSAVMKAQKQLARGESEKL